MNLWRREASFRDAAEILIGTEPGAAEIAEDFFEAPTGPGEISASGSASIGSFGRAAAGALALTGVGSASIGSFGRAAAGALALSASGSASIGVMLGAGFGTSGSPAPQVSGISPAPGAALRARDPIGFTILDQAPVRLAARIHFIRSGVREVELAFLTAFLPLYRASTIVAASAPGLTGWTVSLSRVGGWPLGSTVLVELENLSNPEPPEIP